MVHIDSDIGSEVAIIRGVQTRLMLPGCFPLTFLNNLMYKDNSSAAARTCKQICMLPKFRKLSTTILFTKSVDTNTVLLILTWTNINIPHHGC